MTDMIIVFIIALVILFVLFFLMRELMCWYWKINDIVNILSRIEAKLSVAQNHESVKNQVETEVDEESETMKKYGITFENNKYLYKGYKYDALEKAINYAKTFDKSYPK